MSLISDPFSLGQSKVISRAPLNRWGLQPFEQENPFGLLTTGGLPSLSSSGAFRILRGLGMSELLSTDVVESDTDYSVCVELPGVSPDNCTINQDGQNLTIRADRKSVFNEDNAFYHQRECLSGRVERTFTIPNDAQMDQASARFENGILTIQLPKKQVVPESKPNVKTIPIQSGSTSGSSSSGTKKK